MNSSTDPPATRHPSVAIQKQANSPLESSAKESSPISQFYANKSVLVTGATGFIGKVLIEKILYSCPEVKRIFLLIRNGRNNKSAHDRMIDMVSQKPFNMRLKKEFILNKLVAIESDLSLPNLGLERSDISQLIDNVSIIFHVAASVKFEAPLEVNMCHNVVATRSLLDLACSFKQLQCFVHVSTAYSNCQLRQIDERIYPMEVPEDPISFKVTKEMIDNRPNTYTYTKAMAECVASQYATRMNIVIVRPSIVMSSQKEPTEGWIDTINGPVGLSVLGALGILQKIKVNSEVVFDLIPVDIVTNALVSIAWASTERKQEFLPGSSPSMAIKRSTASPDPNGLSSITPSLTTTASTTNAGSNKLSDLALNNVNENNNCAGFISLLSAVRGRNGLPDPSGKRLPINGMAIGNHSQQLLSTKTTAHGTSETNLTNLDGTVRVFNLTTGSENPCSFYHYFSTGREEAYSKPSMRALRPLLVIPKQKGMNPIQYWIHKIFSHLLFAYIIDTLLSLFGHKKMVIKAVNRMHHANEVFDYFCSNQWNFVTDNVKRLRELQTNEDREKFNSDVRTIDWKYYAQIGWLGCRRFILKEEDETIDYAKKRYRAICFVYYLVKLILLMALTLLVKSFFSSTLIMSMLLMPTYGIVYLL